MKKIFAVSDMHGYLPEPASMPEGDLLLIGGDVTPVWNHDRYFQRDWLRTDFKDWLREIPYENIVGIAGNHDFYAMQNSGFMAELPWTYLQDEAATVGGLKIWGSPWVTRLSGWAFCTTEDVMSDKIDSMDHDIDIFLTHSPPYGFGDLYNRAEHVGSTAIANRLMYDKWPNLKSIVFGHIHEGFGMIPFEGWKLYNVSYLNQSYDSENPNGITALA